MYKTSVEREKKKDLTKIIHTESTKTIKSPLLLFLKKIKKAIVKTDCIEKLEVMFVAS